jgi:hypothetical protein
MPTGQAGDQYFFMIMPLYGLQIAGACRTDRLDLYGKMNKFAA